MGRLTHKARYQAGYRENKDVHVWECIDKLGQLEDLEEQGKLLELPCAVGDIVYTLNPLPSGKTVMAETTADAFFCALCTLENRFGKTVFLTQEDAENALKALES